MKVTIGAQENEGIIIVDTTTGIAQMNVAVSRIEFQLTNDTSKIFEIGTTTLTPTVKTGVTGFEFDESAKTLKVMNGTTTVYSTSTNNKRVLVRVDFNTSTITVFE